MRGGVHGKRNLEYIMAVQLCILSQSQKKGVGIILKWKQTEGVTVEERSHMRSKRGRVLAASRKAKELRVYFIKSQTDSGITRP
jgi:hypothetical protein